jgi:hypothetical protein
MAFKLLPFSSSQTIQRLIDDTKPDGDFDISFHQAIDWCLSQHEFFLYRGHEKSDWPIRASIARFRKSDSAPDGALEDLLGAARENMIEYLRFEAPFRDEEVGLSASDREQDLDSMEPESEDKDRILLHWEMVAQHYGIPTRLLDWSESLLTAIFFAYGGWSWIDLERDERPCVWCLNREKIRSGGIKMRSKAEGHTATLAEYWRYSDAIRVVPRGRFVNPRQRTQTGWFTYMRRSSLSIEEYLEEKAAFFDEGTLIKIDLRPDEQRDVLKMLAMGGTRAAVIRGDIEGISKDAVNKYLRFVFERIV